MKKHLSLYILVFITNQIFAQDTLNEKVSNKLQEVIVSYQADKLTPISFQNISAKEIKAKSVGQEPSFLLSQTPSITNYSDAGSSQGYSYYRLRGIDQTRINTTLDGAPMNEPEDQGAYFSNYPDILNSVNKIQIQRGVSTSKNGVASYAGSIELFSPNLYDSSNTTLGIGYGSFNSFRAFGEYNSGIKNHKALYMRASKVYSDGYKYHSSNNSASFFLSSGLFYDNSTWKLNILAGHQQNELAWLGVSDSLILIDRKTNANKNERDNFTQCFVQIQNIYRKRLFSTIQSSIYYTYLKGNYDFNLNGFLGLPTTSELYNYAFQSNLIGFFCNYTVSKKQFNWTTGIQGNIYNRQHTGSDNMIGQLYKNTGYKHELSVFTKGEYTLDIATFFADVQYRYSTFDYKGSVAFDKLQWTFINPKVGISVSLNSNSTFYYSIGKTGREPTRNDMFGGNDDLLVDNLGNPILSVKTAEYVLNHELGFRFQSNKVNFSSNLYYMSFRNEIVLNGKFGPNGLVLTNNVDKSFRTGIELNATYRINRKFELINNSSFNYSRIEEQKETFTPILTPRIIVNQEVVYHNKGFSVTSHFKYQGKSYIDFSNTSTVNSYLVVDGKVGYEMKRYELSLFVNNITNTKYFNNGYIDTDGSKKYFVQAPTNLYFSVKYHF